jgi:hypothetical protein
MWCKTPSQVFNLHYDYDNDYDNVNVDMNVDDDIDEDNYNADNHMMYNMCYYIYYLNSKIIDKTKYMLKNMSTCDIPLINVTGKMVPC